MKKGAFFLLVVFCLQTAENGFGQEKRPSFGEYFWAAAFGVFLMAPISAGIGDRLGLYGDREGWDRFPHVMGAWGVGATLGANGGALVVSCQKGLVIRINLLTTVLPMAVLFFIDSSRYAFAVVGTLAVPLVAAGNAYVKDLKRWEAGERGRPQTAFEFGGASMFQYERFSSGSVCRFRVAFPVLTVQW